MTLNRSMLMSWAFALIFLCACASLFRHYSQEPAEELQVPKFENESCRQSYEQFYRNPEIDIRVVFGYKDARPARFVADRYERMIFIQRLTQPCRKGQRACGFSRAPDDADLFTKLTVGPDGAKRLVRLRAVQSSAGPDDVENRKDPFQKWKTRQATLAFLNGISRGDAVFYNGHSRAGGGPDFEPPRLAHDGDVNFESYRFHEPGFNQVIAALEGAPSSLKLLGLYSCASTKHFLTRVQKIKPELGLITSPRLIYFSDAMESSLETIAALLAMKCEGSFQKSLESRAARAGGAHVSGFFD